MYKTCTIYILGLQKEQHQRNRATDTFQAPLHVFWMLRRLQITSILIFWIGEQTVSTININPLLPLIVPLSRFFTILFLCCEITFTIEDILAVGLGNDVYFWNEATCEVSQLRNFQDQDAVTSLSWQGVCSHTFRRSFINSLCRGIIWLLELRVVTYSFGIWNIKNEYARYKVILHELEF